MNPAIQQLIEDLEGTENLSLEAGGYVLVSGGKLYSDGRIIKPTAAIVMELWDKEVGPLVAEWEAENEL